MKRLLCLLVFMVALPTAAADRNAIAAGALFYMPGDPLDAGVGFGVAYTRSVARLLLRAELSAMTLDVSAGDQGGDFDFVTVSVGALWPVSPASWPVQLAVGGGIDYVDGDGEVVHVPAPIDIRNSFDADPEIGFHAEFEAAWQFASAWQLFGRLRYLAATLEANAEQSFLISGVPAGDPVTMDLELDGPQLTIGAAFRF
jgi:hypothetical protein